MRTFLTNRNNSLQLNAAGDLETVTGPGAVAMVARHFMLARRGEMIHAADLGMPYELIAWGAQPNIAQFEAAGRATLARVPGVVEVLSFQGRLEGDGLFYEATLRTIYSEDLTIDGQL
ncbi:hypothetical protein [Azorhizophilus paspali]|uniref:Uncharacterized protein n=1 Tax=Azorhizophilus paspali TaxID=69963 RepID=A0ABV6SHN6_AZOPA